MLSPCLVLGLGLAAVVVWGAERDGALNARPCPEGLDRCVEDAVRAAGPAEVLVVGNSLAHTDLDPDLLAEGLGARGAAVLSLPGSVAPHWVAILERAFAAGAHPSTVVVVTDLQSVLYRTPRSVLSRSDLAELVRGDPALEAELEGMTRWSPVAALAGHRVRARAWLLDRLRRVLLAPLAPPGAKPSWAARRADRATRSVFSERDLALATTRAVPTLDEPDDDLAAPEELAPPAESWLPRLVSLVEAHGARLVLVRAPLSPQLTGEQRDPVLPGTEDAVRALLPAPHAYLDAARVPLGLHGYRDVTHLEPPGARRLTAAVTERLAADPVSPGDTRRWTVPGEPPPLRSRAGEPGPGGTTRWVVPQVGDVLLALWAAGVDPPQDCVPVRVVADGRPLRQHPCGELFASARSGACFDGGALYARAPGGAGALSLEVDPGRPCGPYTWLAPGEAAVAELPAGPLALGATGDRPPELEVRAGGDLVPVEATRPAGGTTGAWRAILPVGGAVEVRNASREGLVVLWAAEGGS